MIAVSIVIPANNESENITELLNRIFAAMADQADYEVIVVDDASDDGMGNLVEELMSQHPSLRLIRHDRKAGQSAAVQSGVLAARGDIIATLDGDGQNPPEELPGLIAPLLAEESAAVGLVAGQRVGRKDTISKRLASKFANGLRSWALGDNTRDTGCGLKAFRRDAYLRLPFFNHMHRYLPALFARDGWQVAHVDVTHSARGGGRSHYNNLQRGLVGAVDLLGVMWLLRRRKGATPSEHTPS